MRKGIIAFACLALFAAGDLHAQQSRQVFFGPQLSWGDDADIGIGGRVEGLLSNSHLMITGTFDWFFPDNDNIDYWEINGNLAYRFDIRNSPNIHPYAGGGLNVAHVSVDGPNDLNGSDTDLGLNLVGGSEFTAGGVKPFVELRVSIEGGDQFVITGGVLF